jgi:hypothetical protein
MENPLASCTCEGVNAFSNGRLPQEAIADFGPRRFEIRERLDAGRQAPGQERTVFVVQQIEARPTMTCTTEKGRSTNYSRALDILETLDAERGSSKG